MQLGVYSFGSLAADPATGEAVSTAQSMRNLLEAIRLADEVGLDYFGIGEHHTWEMPASAGATVLAAGAAVTSRILLGSSVTVLSTEDPVRVFQQYATLDALSGGRAEITAGRGSFTDSFPLFGEDLHDYDRLFDEKLQLLLTLNEGPVVSWRGTTRSGLENALVVPRPERGRLPVWLGTGGSPESSVRAGLLGLPISFGIIGGPPERFAAQATIYRRAFAEAGHDADQALISIGNHGFVGDTQERAEDVFHDGWSFAFSGAGASRGRPPRARAQFDAEVASGALFVGDPERVAERIVALHSQIGHMRQFLQMDLGRITQRDLLRSIELLGTRVKPLVDQHLGAEPDDLRGSVPAQGLPTRGSARQTRSAT